MICKKEKLRYFYSSVIKNGSCGSAVKPDSWSCGTRKTKGNIMKKATVIKKYARKEGDTGSPEVQVALLTQRIKHLTEHLRANKKDHSTRRGLMAMVSRRRSLLEYLSKENFESYVKITADLDIRRK
jgi:small subunit ribosomal protein S15